MIFICQTAGTEIKRLLTGEHENVRWFENHRDLITAIRDTDLLMGRYVVITSNNFHGELVSAGTLAAGIRGIQPTAWVFAYSTETVLVGVNGWIDKLDGATPHDVLRQLIEAGIDDPERIPSLETLYEVFPWIKRPR